MNRRELRQHLDGLDVEDLELEKLKAEVRDLTRPPHRSTTFWFGLIAAWATLVGAFASVLDNLNTDIMNRIELARRIQAQHSSFAAAKAELAKAEQERSRCVALLEAAEQRRMRAETLARDELEEAEAFEKAVVIREGLKDRLRHRAEVRKLSLENLKITVAEVVPLVRQDFEHAGVAGSPPPADVLECLAALDQLSRELEEKH